MKDILRLFAALLGGAIGAAAPVTVFYFVWSWCIAQVPATLVWAGLAKVGITLLMVLFGGGATIGLAIILGALAASFVAFITE